jgi:hypothetical protein
LRGRKLYVREIFSDDPDKAAKDFYDKIGLGREYLKFDSNDLEIVKMMDGSLIVYRPITSSPNSPAIEINIKYSSDNCGLKSQKIHFVKIKKGNK